MKEFLQENKVLVMEEALFRKKITAPQEDGGIFSQEQYYNRMTGRTKMTYAERLVCRMVLDDVRAELRSKIEHNPFKKEEGK